MKNLDSNVLIELSKQKASEPLIIVGVQWVDDDAFILYCDKDIPGVHGTLISIESIQNTFHYEAINSTSTQIVVNDSENKLKDFYKNNDLHKRPCFIYQYFGDLDVTEKFTIFQGETNSPIEWNEATRQLSFTVLSEVENREVGFSPEEAQYDYVSYDSIGVPWPLCFGDVRHVPAVRTRTIPTGVLKTRLSIVDPVLYYKLEAISQAVFTEIFMYNYYVQTALRSDALVEHALSIRVPGVMTPRRAKVLAAMKHDASIAASLTNAEAIAAEYIMTIGEQDENERTILTLETELATQKENYEKRKQGKMDWANRTPKQYREDMALIRDQLKTLRSAREEMAEYKAFIERLVDQLHYLLDVQRECFRAQVQCFNTIVGLFAQYNDILNEICYQKKTEVTTIKIEHGEDFPQNETFDLLINDLRVRGIFVGDVFTIQAIMPKYRNVKMGSRQALLNDCNEQDRDASYQTFWIKDDTQSLKNCYALVENHKGEKHIIYIYNQESTKCEFELVETPTPYQGTGGYSSAIGNQIIQSPYQIPAFNTITTSFNGPVPLVSTGGTLPNWGIMNNLIQTIDVANNNMFVNEFISSVNQALEIVEADPLDIEEYFNLRRLQQMIMHDRAENFIFFDAIRPREMYNIIGQDIRKVLEVAAVPGKSWLTRDIHYTEVPDRAEWYANPGDNVYDIDNPYEIYVANILPSDVEAIMAYRTNEHGESYLESVPSSYYTVNEAEVLSDDLTVTSIKFKTPLGSIQSEEWDNDIYVSLSSSVGPNVVQTLKHLIETYTDKTWDTTTFNAIEELFGDKYPANFAILDRPNILNLLSEVAWQARCSIQLVGNVFYLYYLSTEPDSVRSIEESDVKTGTAVLSYSDTESLVTKFTAEWREDYLPDTKMKKFVLRHNLNRYGLHERTTHFYIYNIPELVLKSATFWLIRYANTWKKVRFEVFLRQLDLDLNDAVDLILPTLFDDNTKALIHNINYSPSNYTLEMEFWTPIRAGSSTQYEFAWPADTELTFPLPEDDAGGKPVYIHVQVDQ